MGTRCWSANIKGKVRFFGGNLKATYDFAKKAANVAEENFSAVAGASVTKQLALTSAP